MKTIDPIKKARLQLLLFFIIISVFVGALFVIYNKNIFSKGQREPKETIIIEEVIQNPYAEPQIVENKDFLFRDQLNWEKTIYNNIPNLKVSVYPRAGIIIDLNNSSVLWAKNPNEKIPVASMSKLLTTLLVFEALEKRDDISLESRVKGTKEAATIRVGAMGVLLNQEYILEELLAAAIIRSANDCATLAGQFIYDYSYEKLIENMNLRAKELSMDSTTMINPHGLPEGLKDNISTVTDIAIVANEILKYPDYLKWSSTYQVFAVNGTKELTNTNNLVRKRKTAGVDGLKTGFTNRAGSCLAFSCLRGGRRILGVVAGVQGSINRDNFVEALLDWAYAQK